MKLDTQQFKYINSKPVKHAILKGKSNNGKTEALLYRLLKIKNNYAFQEEDKILFIQKGEALINKAEIRYEKIREKDNLSYLSLLPSQEEIEFISLQNEINKYVKKERVATKVEISRALHKALDNIESKNRKLSKDNSFEILREIRYLKNREVNSLESYKEILGTPLKLRRNSKARIEFYKILEDYNENLRSKGLIDEEDRVILALKRSKEVKGEYVHILIDNVENLSNLEMNFILSLYMDKSYGSITLSIDVDKGENIFSSLVKKGRVYGKKVFGLEKKIFNFKEKEVKVKGNTLEGEKYTFINLKYKNEIQFSDFREEGSVEVLEEVPVFNNIAAGEPILISPEQEDNFLLPKQWIKGQNKKFILRVQGDSMKDVNIINGDLVVIEQSVAPENGDIVAVNIEGSATLKTLCLTRTTITLKAENPAYDSIKIKEDQEFYILGKAIGLIRK